MKSDYKSLRNYSFSLLSLIGILYLIILFSAAGKILPDFLLSLHLIQFFSSDWRLLLEYCTSREFITVLISGFAITFLVINLIKSVFKTIIKVIKTRRFISTISKIEAKDHTIIRTDELLAFTAGFIKPEIYISQGLVNSLDKKELNAVLRHEKEHQDNKDPFKQVWIAFVRESLPAFLFKSSLFTNFEVLTELSADDEAARHVGSKYPVVSSLNKMLPFQNYNLSISGFNLHNDRVEILLQKKTFTSKIFFGLLVAIISLMLMSAVSFAQTDLSLMCENSEQAIEGRDRTYKIEKDEVCTSSKASSDQSCIPLNYSPTK